MTDHPSFLGVKIKNRSVLASGILGVTFSSLKKVYDEGAGIVTTKSIGPEKRKGHSAPVVYDWGDGLINAVGLSNPGIEEFIARYDNGSIDYPVIISIFGKAAGDFPDIAQKLKPLNFSFIELNISCPNVQDEFGTPFSFSVELTGAITRSVKDVADRPVIVKLSPNIPHIVKIARAAEDAGADAICIMNTVGPGMAINTNTAVPVLGNRKGGISGNAVLPLTVKNIYDVFMEVSIPIIGTGGISDTDGALQVLMAGASLFGIGSAVYKKGLGVFKEIENGVLQFLNINHFESTAEIIGLAHKSRKVTYFKVPCHKRNQKPERGEKKFHVFPIKDILHPIRDVEHPVQDVVHPVKRIVQSAEGSVRTLLFDIEDLDKPEPGQFFMLWVPGSDQKPYSVSYYDGNEIGFSIMSGGKFSSTLFKLDSGDPVGLLGPLGMGFDLKNYQSYLLAGGGVGTAPLLFAAAELVRSGKAVNIITGGKTWSSLHWIDHLLKKIKAGSNIGLFYCTEDGSHGEKGMITEHLQGIIDRVDPGCALLCGPEIFIKKAVSIFKQNSIPGQASIERMMKCGIGICGSCCVDDTGDRVCVEGPVFKFDYIDKLNEFGKYKRDESGSLKRID